MDHTATTTRATAPAVIMAAKVLDALAAHQGAATLDQLTAAVHEPRSSVHRVLTTLVAEDLVRRPSGRGGYRIGPKIMAWGAAYLRDVDLLDEFRNVAAPIVDRINETMQLAVMDWPEAVFIAHVDSRRRIRLVAEVGRRVPAHASAVGKAIIAFSGPELLQRYRSFPMEPSTPFTVPSYKALGEQLSAVRRRGWAEALQESSAGLCCLGAPVRRHDGEVVAAMSICVPETSIKASRRRLLGAELLDGCAELSRRLGRAASASTVQESLAGNR